MVETEKFWTPPPEVSVETIDDAAEQLRDILKRIPTGSVTLGRAKRKAIEDYERIAAAPSPVITRECYESMLRRALVVCRAVDAMQWSNSAETAKRSILAEASDLGVRTFEQSAAEALEGVDSRVDHLFAAVGVAAAETIV